MPDIVQISKAIDFVEDNLKEAITVADMAQAVSYSLYHFCRTFNQVTHHTPYDYLMRRRLSESARALLQTNRKIIEIALDYQFGSPETFSRAFKRMFGLQPSQLRKLGCIEPRQLMPRLTVAHLKQIDKGSYLTPVLEEKSAFQVAGVMTLVADERATIPVLWHLLDQELARHQLAVKPADNYGVIFYAKGSEEHGLLYLAAVRVREPDIADTALVVKSIPAMEYARFIHKGPIQDIRFTLDYIYHTWLPKSNQKLARPWILEHYGPHHRSADRECSETQIYIPIGVKGDVLR
jgi:AraC family transcriptional regulator